jgi:hypothetical protein
MVAPWHGADGHPCFIQRQKHGALLADDIAKWGLRFSGGHHLTLGSSLRTSPRLPLPLRNMSFETIGQGEDGSSHFAVAGIAYLLLTGKEWKMRHRHGRGRRSRCRAHGEITVLLVKFYSVVMWRCFTMQY